jgi:hypothetical protein
MLTRDRLSNCGFACCVGHVIRSARVGSWRSRALFDAMGT